MAGKRKNKADEKLPKRVYRHRNSFVYKPTDGSTLKLCSADEPLSVVWKLYENKIKEIEKGLTLQTLVNSFFESADFIELSKNTQKDYRKNSKNILAVFGSMSPDKLEPQHIRMYMDKRGLQSRVQANREKSFLSRAYRWAYERGLVKRNPCIGVRQFKEKQREKYITDVEYDAVYQYAPPVIRVAMEISYLCCARFSDVLNMRKDQVLEEGVFIKQGKTGKAQIKEWSPRLRAAIALSRQLVTDQKVISAYVISKATGGQYSPDGLRSSWAKARAEARIKTGMPLNFTFHDIKAKAISDIEGSSRDKQRVSGHKTERQVATYDRKIQVVPTVEGANSKK